MPADEMGKWMGDQRESDCVSRLVILFGCYYVSSIFDIGIEKRKDMLCEIVIHSAVYIFSPTYTHIHGALRC